MPKSDLVEEVRELLKVILKTFVKLCKVVESLLKQIWRLQAALSEQTDITTYSQQEYEKLQNVIQNTHSFQDFSVY